MNRRFGLERIYINKEIPFHIYDAQGNLLDCIGIRKGDEDPFAADPALYEYIKNKFPSGSSYAITLEDGWAAYFAFFDLEKNLYIAGPANISSGEGEKSRIYHYRRQHRLSQRYLHIPRLTVMEMANLLSLSLLVVNGECVDEVSLMEESNLSPSEYENMEWKLTTYRMESAEQERRHLEYEYEKRHMNQITEGNLEYFEGLSYEHIHMMDEIGKLAEDGIKQYEYMVAATITLVCRAAMEGGITPAIAYAISDVYFQKLEKCRLPSEMIQLSTEVQKEFTAMVKASKGHRGSAYYVEQCKDYIAQNIHKRLSVEEIAKQIGVNRTYLSGRFSEQEGMTISQYSTLIRLLAAENMLKYSDAPISEIAEYLCFSSQSYFGAQFKKKNNMTPAEYRKRNKSIEFSTRATTQ